MASTTKRARRQSRRLATRSKGDGTETDVRRDEFTKVTDAMRDVNNVTRDEFTAATNDIRKNIHELATQLTRIGQMQAELDEVKRTLAKLTAALDTRVSVRR